MSAVTGPYTPSQRPASPLRMRSESPSPAYASTSPRKIPQQHKTDLNSSGSHSKILVSRNGSPKQQSNMTNAQRNVNRDASQTPSRLRSPSPVQQAPRPASARPSMSHRVTQPLAPPKRCASPEHTRAGQSSGSSRKPNSLSTPNRFVF